MAEKKENNQLGARLDPALLKWIRETAEGLDISQGDLVSRMQKAFVESEAIMKYPQWGAQIQDVHFWARSLINAYMAQVEHGDEADKHAREEVQKLLQRKDDLIDEQLNAIKALREEKKQLEDVEKKAEELQHELKKSREQAEEKVRNTGQQLEDLRRANDALLADRMRLESELRSSQERMAGMEIAVASFDTMRAERDAAIARNEEERQQARAAQAQIEEVNAQNQILREKLNDALVGKAVAETAASNLRSYRESNERLHEIIGEQRTMIALLKKNAAEERDPTEV